ncbi:unnamed protein product [Meloidogyne enterolobii]|uniref:Uncharacterized protein n=1 Tax=Meloidogyne enterolobii TaxID=390850 RepID=A0ACB0XWN1_MELEN
MKSTIFNNNKSNKKQTMFANIAALSIIILQLLGQLNITGAKSVGHWNHSLQEGKVTLAKGSRVAVNREDFGQYMWSSEACAIDTVNMEKSNYILPFAYSLTNEEVKKFHDGPLFANGACSGCEEGCVKKTGLELRWTYIKFPSGTEHHLLLTNPSKYLRPNYTLTLFILVATKFVHLAGVEKYTNEYGIKIVSNLRINQTDPKFHFRMPIDTPKFNDQKSICLNNLTENILSPSTWEIVGTRPDPEMSRLLVFHLLPQTASRRMTMKVEDLVTGKKYVVKNEHPEGPECDFMEISFDKSSYKLLTVSPITSTPKKPTLPTHGLPIMQQKTAPSSKGATKSPSKTTVTKAKTKRTSTTKDSSGSLFLVVMIVVVVIILVAIGIGIAVYFVSRKDSGKKEKGVVRPNK